MASMTIRNLDDQIKQRLRVRAAHHGRSMEDEVREILKSAVSEATGRETSLVASIRARIEPFGGIDLPSVPREPIRPVNGFDE
jgi:plasmid stability protein